MTRPRTSGSASPARFPSSIIFPRSSISVIIKAADLVMEHLVLLHLLNRHTHQQLRLPPPLSPVPATYAYDSTSNTVGSKITNRICITY
ncbi:hypothetical protein LXL04_037736 [Taraxacum kok-saghyz]